MNLQGQPLFRRIKCVLQYHVWQHNYTESGHCFGFETEEGKRKGKFGLHDEKPLQLRDTCIYCGEPK